MFLLQNGQTLLVSHNQLIHLTLMTHLFEDQINHIFYFRRFKILSQLHYALFLWLISTKIKPSPLFNALDYDFVGLSFESTTCRISPKNAHRAITQPSLLIAIRITPSKYLSYPAHPGSSSYQYIFVIP